MQNLKDLFFNYYLLTAVAGWFVAQIVKLFTTHWNRNFSFIRFFFGSGGMPSSHTSACAALTVSCLIRDGSSSATAISCLLLFIVMVDASGVRRVTGQQSEILNATLDALRDTEPDLPDEKLKEMIGHTPRQVFVGLLVGIAVGILMHFIPGLS